ncbi:MAG: CAAX prenyl protease-related protein [Chthoniobacterales bacterium]
MDSEPSTLTFRKIIAYTLPMAVFVSLLTVNGLMQNGVGPFGLSSCQYWIYPIQTILCGALLFWFWDEYELRAPRRAIFAIGLGLFVFVIWIAPQQFLGFAPRLVGFDPEVFNGRPPLFWANLGARFLRLAVVVPLIEEIFWRGFLLRYLIKERFTSVTIGTFSWLSFWVVTLAFGFSHSRADWVAALITGALYNVVAYRTRSLSSCVISHALTNLLLGLWIMATRQWGFW